VSVALAFGNPASARQVLGQELQVQMSWPALVAGEDHQLTAEAAQQ
jgi:hypothetical protein